MKRKEKPTGRWHAGNTHLRKQVVLSRIFKRMVPIDYSINQKRSIRNLFFYLYSNSFAIFLSQTSNLVHRSLHLSTWSPRFTSHDLYLRCRSLASRAKHSFNIFVLRRSMAVTLNYLCFDCLILKKWKRTMKILTSLFHSQFFVAFVQRAIFSL